MMHWKRAAGAITGLGLLSTGATAQEALATAAAPQEEMLSATAPTGPEWRVFSESDTMVYLIDLGAIGRVGEDAEAKIARVRKTATAGDYSHVVDTFALRCGPGEARVIRSTEVYEDGEASDSFPVDEPWTRAEPRSFDAAIKDIACGEMMPGRDPFTTIRAYMDAGRP